LYLKIVKGGNNIKFSIDFSLTKPLKSLIYKWYRGCRKRTLHLYAVTAINLVLPRANAETSYSVRYDLVVVVISIIGSGEKFSYRMVRS
jgi:hypothetical protein